MTLARTFEGVLKTAGILFGDGKPLKGKLIRVTQREGPSYEVTGQSTTEHEFFCVWGEFDAKERLSGLIEDEDAKLEVGADSLTVAPKAGDRVIVQDKSYDVKGVRIERAGGVPLLYSLRVKT